MSLQERVEELKRDLLNENGPQISTMGNYPFAILQYEPEDEFKMRELIYNLVEDLRCEGWNAKNISLFDLLVKRLESEDEEDELFGDDELTGKSIIEEYIISEKKQYNKHGLDRSLNYLKSKFVNELEGHDGITADLINEIKAMVTDDNNKTVVFLSRAGALYPFHKTSGLLRYLDGNTLQVPVVLLYPGTRSGTTALSFMGEYEVDRDYRPRIYGANI